MVTAVFGGAKGDVRSSVYRPVSVAQRARRPRAAGSGSRERPATPSRTGEVNFASMAREARQPRTHGGVARSELDRRHAESRREAAEDRRVEAEGRRVGAESKRAAAEELRRIAEEARAFWEKARASAEDARRAADEARRYVDTVRTLAEGIRRGAEVKRESAEAVRRESASRSEAMTRQTIREEMEVFSELQRTKAEWPRSGGPADPRSPAERRRRPR